MNKWLLPKVRSILNEKNPLNKVRWDMAYQRGFFVAKGQNLLLAKADPKSKKKIISFRITSKSINPNYSKRIFEKATQVLVSLLTKLESRPRNPAVSADLAVI